MGDCDGQDKYENQLLAPFHRILGGDSSLQWSVTKFQNPSHYGGTVSRMIVWQVNFFHRDDG